MGSLWNSLFLGQNYAEIKKLQGKVDKLSTQLSSARGAGSNSGYNYELVHGTPEQQRYERLASECCDRSYVARIGRERRQLRRQADMYWDKAAGWEPGERHGPGGRRY